MESSLSFISQRFLNFFNDKFSSDKVSGYSSYSKMLSLSNSSSITELLEVSILYGFYSLLLRNLVLKENASKTEFFKLYIIGKP